ncbi:hypothetical protein FSARC_10091 [Fusarium sarcochroum]|uniref:DUF7580 domain-containing protein n=1 Tax=Fusarium sarcochroum TaxID=1208366 RepID=A0A8H4TPI7_9HYPO|nr:hypothetical protein FSARC_10091 [Fusarium sarcochroum]
MSGLEIAGVVLGAIPLVVSALEHYQAGKGIAASVIKWRGLLDTLISRLKKQRILFYLEILDLLRESGVPEAVNQPYLPEEECLRVLRDAKTGHELQNYLGNLYGMFLDILKRYETCLKEVASKLRHIQRLPNASKDDLKALLAANPPNGTGFNFKGRLSFTIERRALRELLQELNEERLSLKTIIKGARTRQEFSAREPSLEAKRLAFVFSQVQEGARSLFAAMCHGCTCSCMASHTVLMQLKNRLPQERERTMKTKKETTMFNLVFPLDGSLQEASVKAHPVDESMHLTLNLVSQSPSPGGLKVPSITLNPITTTQCAEPTRVTDICHVAKRARASGKILQMELTLHTLSAIETPSERGREFSTATNLEQVLLEGYRNENARMTPKQCTLLALDVAAAIPQLRETTWLSLPWGKRSIKLLSSQARQIDIEPFVEQTIGATSLCCSSGWPDPKAALLELAILLLEIWHQRTLETWAVTTKVLDVESPDMRRILAIRWLEATSERLPLHHLMAIEQCLAICSGRLRKWQDEEFLRHYCENVIKPLQESCKTW